MDILRAALGERTMSYLGASYGTKLGATYAQLFPQRVGRFVLDGAVDPELGTRATSVQQAKGFQTALDAYAANCVQASIGCFLGKDVDGVEHTISSLLDRSPIIRSRPATGRSPPAAPTTASRRRSTTASTGSS